MKDTLLSNKTDSNIENENILEILRTRLNVLNTSVFLLADKLNNSDVKTSEYIKKINRELDRIRNLITNHIPRSDRDD